MFACNLITLDAAKILCNLLEQNLIRQDGNYRVNFKYDLSDKNAFGRDIILSEDVFADNALFFQLRKVLPNAAEHIDEKNFMRSAIVFMDFKKVFANDLSSVALTDTTPSKADLLSDKGLVYRLRQLFEDGLLLSFDGEEYRRFVPFDKSSSMARSCQITFLDLKFKTALDKRLMLDMNFMGRKLALSKFYAYRGLYLSAAFRLDVKSFPLNEETVVVLPDCKTTLPQTVFTASGRNEQGLWKYETTEKILTLKLFDGEGLISPDLAKCFSDDLRIRYDFKAASHSFQIRLPFTKGVLHEVDFNKFFSEQANCEVDALFIKDIFGVTRDLRKAKIILTQSMFKCADWMIESNSFGLDPMKYFFEKFAEYEHAVYVTNTEARLSNPGNVKLNYQFLSTLALTDEDFDTLVDDQRKAVDSFGEKFSVSLAESESEEFDETDDNLKLFPSLTRTTCLKTAAKNSAFLRDPKVKGIYDDMLKNYECNLGLGRLEVEGEQRFLSCDLLVLLTEILEHAENISLDTSQKNFLRKQRLYPDRFFMPENKFPIKPDKHYAFLRNPHLSRNEQVLLRACVKRGSLHEKYFSHLKGVVMISAMSTAAMSLGGADYDGDLVKVVADSRIIQAIKRGNCDFALPPIEIPSAKSKQQELGYSIPLSVIVDTFSNKVGEISNLAVKLAGREYFSAPAEEYKDACAKCTIVVGLEIDAAKTGIHPAENIAELKTLAKGCGKSIFLDTKKIIGKILGGNCPPIVVRRDNTLTLYLSSAAKERGLSSLIVSLDEKGTAFLDRLPAEYLQLIVEHTSSLPARTDAPSQFFDFEISGWRKTLNEDKRAELRKLVKAYLRILSLDRRTRFIKNAAKEKSFHGHVLNILKLQYDDLYQKLSCGVELSEALNQLYAELSFRLGTASAVKNALSSLKVQRWHLTAEQDRPCVAAKILGIAPNAADQLPNVFELLYNFRCNGFMIFFYVLKELHLRLFEESDVAPELEEVAEELEPYYDELHEVYSTSVAEKKSKSIWNEQLVRICRRHLRELFGDDMSEALECYWSRRSEDLAHNFLWNVFTEQEIFSQLYVPAVQG